MDWVKLTTDYFRDLRPMLLSQEGAEIAVMCDQLAQYRPPIPGARRININATYGIDKTVKVEICKRLQDKMFTDAIR